MYYVGITLSILFIELLAVGSIAGSFYMYEKASSVSKEKDA